MHTYTYFAREAACAYRYGFCALSGLCICIRILRVKRLVHTDTDSLSFQNFGDTILRICQFIRRTNDPILRFVDSFAVCATDRDGPPGGSVRRM